MSTIPATIARQARHASDATAITAPGRDAMCYGQLWTSLQDAAAALRAVGIRRGSRVALVLPNGPEMAVAFLAVSSCAVAAPLNPDYRHAEFLTYLSALRIQAVMVQDGIDSPARAAARELGLALIELAPGRHAGLFTLNHSPVIGAAFRDWSAPQDQAVVFLTSGTTARPKVVPLTHRNICAGSANVRASLELTPRDRCLNVMPLFHSQGLLIAMQASLSAGASVCCAPGFQATQFFDWVEEFQPTWYTAIPAIHQAIVSLAGARESRRQLDIARRTLRFARGSSGALTPSLADRLEDIFRVPVIDAYGLIEAAQPIASNPLPPRVRKSGSVGVAAGLDLRVMAPDGSLLPPDRTGEIVVRGPNVFQGYEDDPKPTKPPSNTDGSTPAMPAAWTKTDTCSWTAASRK